MNHSEVAAAMDALEALAPMPKAAKVPRRRAPNLGAALATLIPGLRDAKQTRAILIAEEALTRAGLADAAEALRAKREKPETPMFRQLGAGVLKQEVDWHPIAEPDEKLVVSGAWGETYERLVTELGHVERFVAAGIDPPSRILFTGATGTGKTLAARWLAWRLGLPIVVTRIDGIVESFLGASASKLRKVFDEVAGSPCVLFLDELDGISANRHGAPKDGGQAANEELARTTLALLQMLDGLPKGQIVIGATNCPERLDAALARRLYERVEFGAPGEEARFRMVEAWLCKAPVTDGERVALVERSEGWSGADLRAEAMRMGRKAIMEGAGA